MPIFKGHHIFGPVAQITWGAKGLLTANLALVLELGERLRLLILAQIAVILPRPENDLIRLKMDAVGVIDFDQGRASLDATLHDSRLLKKFTLTGDMAMRLKWQDGPNFALAVGGLHPAFNPPPNFPKLERVAINLSSSDKLRIRCEAYFALTSNTVQFGSRTELYAEALGFSFQGEIGYDVLIQLDPFQFLADFHAQVQLKRGSKNLFKVRLEGELSGPRPLRIKSPEPADEEKLEPAWTSGSQSPAAVTLPVYFNWEFRTSAGDGAKTTLLQTLDPEKTINARAQASLSMDGAAGQVGDPLEPIMDAPGFPHPMYEALRDLSQDFLFPGLEHVPPNTATMLETNTKFVEAFMVGLNTEMSAELLWRNYPTDQRGTYFRHFWDGDQSDIGMIKEWGDSNLGDNASAGENLVLLIRGELLRRYPNSVIYAVAAVEKDGQLDLSTGPQDERHPLFRGALKPDVTFLGFDLTPPEAVADPGWFFVFQQQPRPRTIKGSLTSTQSEPLPPRGGPYKNSAPPHCWKRWKWKTRGGRDWRAVCLRRRSRRSKAR